MGRLRDLFAMEEIKLEPGDKPLEIDKLVAAKELSDKSQSYDSTYVRIKQDLEKPEEEDNQDTASGDSGTSEEDDSGETDDSSSDDSSDSDSSQPSDNSSTPDTPSEPNDSEEPEDDKKEDENKGEEEKSDEGEKSDKGEDSGDKPDEHDLNKDLFSDDGDSDKKDEKPEKSDVDDKDDKAKPAKESLRESVRVFLSQEDCRSISLEESGDDGSGGGVGGSVHKGGGLLHNQNNAYKSGGHYVDPFDPSSTHLGSSIQSVKEGAKAVAHLGYYGSKELAGLGVKYGPGLAKSAWKAVSGVAGGLFNGISSTVVWTKRKFNSIEGYKSDLEDLLKHIEEVDAVNEKPEEHFYTEVSHINLLKAGDKVAVVELLGDIKTFFTQTMDTLNKEVHDELISLSNHIASDVRTKDVVDEVMGIKFSSSGFEKRLLSGAVPSNKKLVSFVSSQVLPGDERLVVYVPNGSFNTVEEYKDIFDDCEMFFSKDKTTFREIEKIPFLNKEKLVEYIKLAISLCEDAIHHKHMYEEILNIKMGMKERIKDFVGTLLESKDEDQSIDLSEAIFLKQRFIDRFYIAGSMDCVDYTVRYIKSAIAYAEKNIEHL